MKLKSKVVVLAAGQSSRMGQPKALLSFNQKTLLEYQIESIQKMGVKPVVVLGYHHSTIQTAIPKINEIAQVIVNSKPEQGQFSSLVLGLKNCDNEAVFVLPLDTPAPSQATWGKIESHLNSFSVIVPRHDNRGGHPVLLSASFARALLSKDIPENEKRLDLQIKKIPPEQYLSVSIEDPAILVDLDTPNEVKLYFKCL